MLFSIIYVAYSLGGEHVAATGLRSGEKYYQIPNYTMKCRLYPNKTAAAMIDRIIFGVQLAYNHTVYEIFNNHLHLKEPDKNGDHYVDFGYLASKAHRHHLIAIDSRIEIVPASALMNKNGLFKADLKRAMALPSDTREQKELKRKLKAQRKKCSFKKTPRTTNSGALLPFPIEKTVPSFYNRNKHRMSYTYQETCTKISACHNHNVFKINLINVGSVKVRGWNERIRFGEHQEYNFVEWMELQSSKQQVTVTISKDTCGDYYICFKLSGNLSVWKPIQEPTKDTVGIDIGIKAAVITSDGEKFENRKYKQQEEDRLTALNRQLSRREGYANVKFRERAKLFQKQGIHLHQSNRYLSTQKALAKAHRKITRKRNHHNNNITTTLVSSYQGIGVESLNVSGMMHNKHLAKSIADVAFSTILAQIKYKSDWYQRQCIPINKRFPSSKKCHNCGFVFDGLTLSMRDWTCVRCRMHHDRDINAAINIRMEAFNENSNV